jgi:hypothetical protein
MTISELAGSIGREASLSVESFAMRVKIMDIKQAYGRERYLVVAVDGAGKQWVESSRLTFPVTNP